VPLASDPAGMLIVAMPPLRVAAADVKLPLLSITEPVGVGLPVPPLTATLTDNDWAVVMVVEDGVTVIVGVASGATCET
jgi:hypothetical protein